MILVRLFKDITIYKITRDFASKGSQYHKNDSQGSIIISI